MNIWSDCKKLPLTEVLSFIVDNRGKTVPTTTSGHILIATNCIKNDRLYPCYEKIRFLSEDTYQSFFRSHPIPGDILFVCKGTPGRCALVPDPIDFCIAQDMVGLRANKSIIDNKYLLAVLRSYEIQKFIYNTSVGDVIPHFKKQFFNKLLIPVPPMELQTKIGAFYYSISQKIENNNKINANLEAQAQALFKSWFVDFTPFKDQPFVDSELGSIPQGWKVVSLDDMTSKVGTGLNPRKNFTLGQGSNYYVTIKNMYNNRVYLDSRCDKITDEAIQKIQKRSKLQVGDLLFSGIGTIGRVALINKPPYNWNTSESVFNLHPSEEISSEFLYLLLLSNFFQNYVKINTLGGVQQGIRMASLKSFRMALPDRNVLIAFDRIIQPIVADIKRNDDENDSLAALRDTLLPKLMSGEIKL